MMKKITLLLLALLSTTFTHGQTLTLKTGLSLSGMSWENSLLPADILSEDKVGFEATVGIDYLQKKFFWLSSDIGYVLAAASGYGVMDPTDPFQQSESTEYNANFHFIKFNSIAHFKVNLTKNFYPYIGVGPELNYMMNYEDYPGVLEIFDPHGDLNNFFYGIAGVAGIRYETNRFAAGFEFLYSYALNKMLSIEAYGVKNEISVAYSTYSFTIGYRPW